MCLLSGEARCTLKKKDYFVLDYIIKCFEYPVVLAAEVMSDTVIMSHII